MTTRSGCGYELTLAFSQFSATISVLEYSEEQQTPGFLVRLASLVLYEQASSSAAFARITCPHPCVYSLVCKRDPRPRTERAA